MIGWAVAFCMFVLAMVFAMWWRAEKDNSKDWEALYNVRQEDCLKLIAELTVERMKNGEKDA